MNPPMTHDEAIAAWKAELDPLTAIDVVEFVVVEQRGVVRELELRSDKTGLGLELTKLRLAERALTVLTRPANG